MNWLKRISGGRNSGKTMPELPAGVRVYATGDIHGRIDLLERMEGLIRQDLAVNPVEQSIEVFLGDYVDRGPDSKAVLEYLSASRTHCDRRICLKGNHEDILLEFLDVPGILDHWRDLGGMETLYSYGVQPPRTRAPDHATRCRDEFERAVPDTHIDFLRNLPLHIEIGSYLFVHAGLRPGRPLEPQDEKDLLWIREPFLASWKDHGFIVVHGHTPQQEYEVRANRINVDTWAYLSGCLTCVVLEGETQRFIQASV